MFDLARRVGALPARYAARAALALLVGCGARDGHDAGASVCSRGEAWDGGVTSSARMNPGLACIACHTRSGAAVFSVGGTVYPTANEPDQCFGVRLDAVTPVTVEVTDALGRTASLPTNSAGNFYHRLPLTPPLRVSVRRGEAAREMRGGAPSGDCNACHTEWGREGAPGRVRVP